MQKNAVWHCPSYWQELRGFTRKHLYLKRMAAIMPEKDRLKHQAAAISHMDLFTLRSGVITIYP